MTLHIDGVKLKPLVKIEDDRGKPTYVKEKTQMSLKDLEKYIFHLQNLILQKVGTDIKKILSIFCSNFWCIQVCAF